MIKSPSRAGWRLIIVSVSGVKRGQQPGNPSSPLETGGPVGRPSRRPVLHPPPAAGGAPRGSGARVPGLQSEAAAQSKHCCGFSA